MSNTVVSDYPFPCGEVASYLRALKSPRITSLSWRAVLRKIVFRYSLKTLFFFVQVGHGWRICTDDGGMSIAR